MNSHYHTPHSLSLSHAEGGLGGQKELQGSFNTGSVIHTEGGGGGGAQQVSREGAKGFTLS